jgi:hypothetical protein
VILEAITGPDIPWDDLHHISYFLLKTKRIKAREFITTVNGDAPCIVNPMATKGIYDKGNMESIDEMIPIDISRTPGVMENIFIIVDCSPKEIQINTELFKEFRDVFSRSYEEIPEIDPRIIENEIIAYPNVNHIRHNLIPINPCKAAMINVEVEKLIKDGFIYPMQLTEWVANPIPVNKK